MKHNYIFDLLPYGSTFLFVDELVRVSEEIVEGYYTFKKDEYFYPAHFKDYPVTPGVILTECMAQIGLVCMGIYLMRSESFGQKPNIALSSSQMDYYLPVFPGEKVKVVSEKEYFRFNKLKCRVKMFNRKDELVAKGILSGMILMHK